jgi:hypothetical protein
VAPTLDPVRVLVLRCSIQVIVSALICDLCLVNDSMLGVSMTFSSICCRGTCRKLVTMHIQPGNPNSGASSDIAASILSTTTTNNETLSVSLYSDPVDKSLLITVTPPPCPAASSEKSVGRRAPLDICCVIDVSGSMSSGASIPADPATGKPAESNGLSVLDVVKHSLRTIVTTMQEGELQ